MNAARDRLAKVSGILKQFRQAVLAVACSGRLTNENVESDEVPLTWQWHALEELLLPGGLLDGARDHGSGTAVESNQV